MPTRHRRRLRQRDALAGWLDRQASESLWTPSITVFEIRLGLALLAASRQRKGRGVDMRDTRIADSALTAAATQRAVSPA